MLSSDIQDRFLVDWSRYVPGSDINIDSFSKVTTGMDRTTGHRVGIVRSMSLGDDRARKSFIRAIKILATNSHPATLSLIGYDYANLDKRDMFAVVPPVIMTLWTALGLSPGGVGILNATQKSIILFGVVSGFAYLHSRSVLHRNIKPRNIFLKSNFEPLIGGFDLSRFLRAGRHISGNYIGTRFYIAPEMILNQDSDFALDVYSFAIILYQFFHPLTRIGDLSVQRMSRYRCDRSIVDGERFERVSDIPDYHWSLISRCWTADPALRPLFCEILEEFIRTGEYVLPGADIDAVRAHESRIGDSCGRPGSIWLCGDDEESDDSQRL
jgi:serine/threonine protein kinase